MRQAIIFSLILHTILMLLLIFGFPHLFGRMKEPAAISVEILPISELSNIPKKSESKKSDAQAEGRTVVKASKREDAPQEEPQKEEEKLKDKKEDAKPVPVSESTKQDKKEVEKLEHLKEKEQPKKKENKPKNQDKPKKKPNKASELDSLLKTLETPVDKKTDEAKENKEAKDNSQEESKLYKGVVYNPNAQLSLSLQDAIKSQIRKCWMVPLGAKDLGDMSVVLKISVAEDGTIGDNIEVDAEHKPMNVDASFYRAFVDSAFRAIKMCSPLQGLPADQYRDWKELKLNFDPRDMLD